MSDEYLLLLSIRIHQSSRCCYMRIRIRKYHLRIIRTILYHFFIFLLEDIRLFSSKWQIIEIFYHQRTFFAFRLFFSNKKRTKQEIIVIYFSFQVTFYSLWNLFQINSILVSHLWTFIDGLLKLRFFFAMLLVICPFIIFNVFLIFRWISVNLYWENDAQDSFIYRNALWWISTWFFFSISLKLMLLVNYVNWFFKNILRYSCIILKSI